MASLKGQFRFDVTKHLYHVGQTRLPSITQVIAGAAEPSAASAFYTPEARARGSLVHALTATYDLTGLWPSEVPADVLPRLAAYASFLGAAMPVWEAIEVPLVSRRWKFAGTPDRVGTLQRQPVVVDLKCGGPDPSQGVQTAAQVILVDGSKGPGQRVYVRHRYTLHLRDDGTYRLVEWSDPADYDLWWWSLSQHNQKEN